MATNSSSFFRSWPGIAAMCLVPIIAALCFLHKDIGTRYLKSRIESAKLPADELSAYRLANEWSYRWSHGYAVDVADSEHEDFRPWVTGDYDRVAYVRIVWSNGTVVEKPLLNRESLTYIFGE